MSTVTRRVLIVDDSAEDRESYRRLLKHATGCEYVLSESESGEEGLAHCQVESPDCVLLDYGLPDVDGVEFLDGLAGEAGVVSVPVVMLTGQGNEAVAVQAMKHGAQDYLVKGALTAESLVRAIENAIEKRSLQSRLQQSIRELQIKNTCLTEMRDTAHQFVDHVSHEFRTPLTVIREFASIMYDGLAGDINDEQREYLEIIVHRVDDLSVLVDDMLDTSKLESGLLGISRADSRLEEIVERVRTTLERRAAASKAHLEIDVPSDLPAVYCDAEKIGRIIINLAINALKFCGEPGAVTLRARANPREHEIAVSVVDNGPGISPENLAALFQRFRQIEGQSGRGFKGFGLGLSIAKELVNLNFGDITVESEPGRGSAFSFTIPFAERRPLLQRYLRKIENIRNGSTRVALVQLTSESAADAERLNELEQLVQYHTRRNDVLFRAAPHRWLLVAAANQAEVQPMIDRVEKARALADRNRAAGSLPNVTWQCLGSWNVHDEAVAFIERFMSVIKPPEPAYV